jgi:hypothetical protein
MRARELGYGELDMASVVVAERERLPKSAKQA